MNSYEKKKRTIEIYQTMVENLRIYAEDMKNDPESYVPSEYAGVPKVSEDVKTIVKEAAKIFLDEIRDRMLEIYKL